MAPGLALRRVGSIGHKSSKVARGTDRGPSLPQPLHTFASSAVYFRLESLSAFSCPQGLLPRGSQVVHKPDEQQDGQRHRQRPQLAPAPAQSCQLTGLTRRPWHQVRVKCNAADARRNPAKSMACTPREICPYWQGQCRCWSDAPLVYKAAKQDAKEEEAGKNLPCEGL